MNEIEEAPAQGIHDDKILGPDASDPLSTLDSKDVATEGIYGVKQTYRHLKPRQVQMLALSGSIGTGLYVGMGSSLATAGPAGLLLAYICFALLFWGSMNAAGEIVSWLPVDGAMVQFAERFVDKSLAFGLGWFYVYHGGVVIAAEAVAVAGLMKYWTTAVNSGVWCAIFLVTCVLVNIFGVRIYGEGQFFLGSFKIILIIGLLLYTFVVMLGGNPQHDRFGFRYWYSPGPFVPYLAKGATGNFAGFWAIFVQAAYAFGTPDFLAYAAGEAQSPRRVMPNVFSRVIYRLVFFYVLGALATGILVPSNNKALTQSLAGAGSSPFVISAKDLGIPFLPDLINALVLTSAWSCGFEICYATTRCLYGLALAGQAPALFKVTWRGVPTFCVLGACLFGCLSFLSVSNNSTTVFTWITKLVGTFVFTDLIIINVLYIRFRKGVEYEGVRDRMPYRVRGQVAMSWICIAVFSILLLTNGFAVFAAKTFVVQNFIFAYASPFFFIVPYVAHKIYTAMRGEPVKMKSVDEMDVMTGVDYLEREELSYPPLRGRLQRWLWGA